MTTNPLALLTPMEWSSAPHARSPRAKPAKCGLRLSIRTTRRKDDMAKDYVNRAHVPVLINDMSARVLASERLRELEARDPMNLGRDDTLDYIADVRND